METRSSKQQLRKALNKMLAGSTSDSDDEAGEGRAPSGMFKFSGDEPDAQALLSQWKARIRITIIREQKKIPTCDAGLGAVLQYVKGSVSSLYESFCVNALESKSLAAVADKDRKDSMFLVEQFFVFLDEIYGEEVEEDAETRVKQFAKLATGEPLQAMYARFLGLVAKLSSTTGSKETAARQKMVVVSFLSAFPRQIGEGVVDALREQSHVVHRMLTVVAKADGKDEPEAHVFTIGGAGCAMDDVWARLKSQMATAKALQKEAGDADRGASWVEKPTNPAPAAITRVKAETGAVCRDFVTGRCAAGRACPNKHDTELRKLVRPGNAPSGGNGTGGEKPPKSSTAGACRLFTGAAGSCRFGDKCRFTHDQPAAGGSVAAAASSGYDGSQEVCRFWARTATCKFGAACKFKHEGGVAKASPMCFEFQSKGSCKFGAACKFQHGGAAAADAGKPKAAATDSKAEKENKKLRACLMALDVDENELDDMMNDGNLSGVVMCGQDNYEGGRDVVSAAMGRAALRRVTVAETPPTADVGRTIPRRGRPPGATVNKRAVPKGFEVLDGDAGKEAVIPVANTSDAAQVVEAVQQATRETNARVEQVRKTADSGVLMPMELSLDAIQLAECKVVMPLSVFMNKSKTGGSRARGHEALYADDGRVSRQAFEETLAASCAGDDGERCDAVVTLSDHDDIMVAPNDGGEISFGGKVPAKTIVVDTGARPLCIEQSVWEDIRGDNELLPVSKEWSNMTMADGSKGKIVGEFRNLRMDFLGGAANGGRTVVAHGLVVPTNRMFGILLSMPVQKAVGFGYDSSTGKAWVRVPGVGGRSTRRMLTVCSARPGLGAAVASSVPRYVLAVVGDSDDEANEEELGTSISRSGSCDEHAVSAGPPVVNDALDDVAVYEAAGAWVAEPTRSRREEDASHFPTDTESGACVATERDGEEHDSAMWGRTKEGFREMTEEVRRGVHVGVDSCTNSADGGKQLPGGVGELVLTGLDDVDTESDEEAEVLVRGVPRAVEASVICTVQTIVETAKVSFEDEEPTGGTEVASDEAPPKMEDPDGYEMCPQKQWGGQPQTQELFASNLVAHDDDLSAAGRTIVSRGTVAGADVDWDEVLPAWHAVEEQAAIGDVPSYSMGSDEPVKPWYQYGAIEQGKALQCRTVTWPRDVLSGEEGISVIELCGGVASYTISLLRAGFTIDHLAYVDADPEVRETARQRLYDASKEYGGIEMSTIDAAFCEDKRVDDVHAVTRHHLHQWGVGHSTNVFVGCGAPCVALSSAGLKLGSADERFTVVERCMDLVAAMQQASQVGREVVYYFENCTSVQSHGKFACSTAVVKAHEVLRRRLGGHPCVIDAVQVGSAAHRLRAHWTNAEAAGTWSRKVQAMEEIVVPCMGCADAYLEPGAKTKPSAHDDKEPWTVVNREGEELRAFPTVTARTSSWSNGAGGAGRVYGDGDEHGEGGRRLKPEEIERVMGFEPGATAVGQGVNGADARRRMLGNSLDANVGLALMESMRVAMSGRVLRHERRRARAEAAITKVAMQKRVDAQKAVRAIAAQKEERVRRLRGSEAGRLRSAAGGTVKPKAKVKPPARRWGQGVAGVYAMMLTLYTVMTAGSIGGPTDGSVWQKAQQLSEPSETLYAESYAAGDEEGKRYEPAEDTVPYDEYEEWERTQPEFTEQSGAWSTAREEGLACKLANDPGDYGELEWDLEGSLLTVEQRARFVAMLDEVRGTFAATQKELAEKVDRDSEADMFHIDTGDEGPAFSRGYRHPKADEDLIRSKCEELHERGLIEPAQDSKWASPTVLARKKDADGKWKEKRMCGDYREVNRKTKLDEYRLEDARAIFDKVGRAKYITVMDARQGYNQMTVHPKDRDKTTFVGADRKLWRCVAMPFGLTNAGVHFGRRMDRALLDLDYVRAFVDDIIVYSDTAEEHEEHVRAVLTRLGERGILVHPGKCLFAQAFVKYLGHRIGGGILSMDHEHDMMCALRDMPRPRSVKQLRSFLGMVNYYRDFMGSDYSRVTKCLHRLTSKASSLNDWGKEHDEAFAVVKEKVDKARTLHMPDWSKPFILATDWSEHGIGAVLSQLDDKGVEQPILFASRTLNEAESRYSSYDGECLAAVWAMSRFRYFLTGHHFKMYTDNAALTALMKSKTLKGRASRWVATLQEFTFDIEHRAGVDNGNADALSRNPVHGDPHGDEGYAGAVAAAVRPGTVRRDGWDVWDDEHVIFFLRGGTHVAGLDDAEKRRVEKRSAALRQTAEGVAVRVGGDWRVWPPPQERKGVLRAVHLQAGHCGVKKTEEVARQRYWWPSMRSDVQEVCGECRECDTVHASFTRENTELLSVPIRGLGYRWNIDLAGPFTKSEQGNTYVLVMVEAMSKWVEIVPISGKTAQAVADAFELHILSRFGAPAEVISDQGNEFEAVFDDLCARHRIVHRTTSRGHPQSNGLAERLVQVFKRGARKLMLSMRREHGGSWHAKKRVDGDELDAKWESTLVAILAGYRFTRQSASKLTPYFVLYGRDPVMLRAFMPEEDEMLPVEDEAMMMKMLAERAKVFDKNMPMAMANELIAQQRDRLRYLQTRSGGYKPRKGSFAAGDFVYLRRDSRSTLDGKVHDVILRVVEVTPKGTLVLEGRDTRTMEEHAHNCAPCGLRNVDCRTDAASMDIRDDHFCRICRYTDNEASMLLCDSCNRGFHFYCVGLDEVPDGAWLCEGCAKMGGGPAVA